MPATSKAHFRFMHAVAQGDVKVPGLSKEKAAEFVEGQSPVGLPERAAKAGLHRLVNKVKQARTGKRFRVG